MEGKSENGYQVVCKDVMNAISFLLVAICLLVCVSEGVRRMRHGGARSCF